jgi:MYXO-CTERM domain-containing protein
MLSPRRGLLCLGILVAGVAASSDVSAIQNGQSTIGEFQSLAFKVGASASTSVFVCSATLIAPNLALTARHCLYKFGEIPVDNVACGTGTFTPNDVPADSLWLSTDSKAAGEVDRHHQVAKYFVPLTTEVCGADIAVLQLKDKILPAEATPAEPDLSPLDGGRDSYERHGTSIVMVGHGESTVPPSDNDIGIRNIRQDALLQCVYGSERFRCREKQDTAFTTKEFIVKDGACPGDSGSGAYSATAYASNRRVVLGVQSRASIQGGLCIHDVYARVDAWATLIIDAAKEAAQAGGYPLPGWASIDTSRPLPGARTPFSPGKLGAECNSNSECESGSCIITADRLTTCASACSDASQCPTNFRCSPSQSANYCTYQKPSPTESSGCSYTSEPPSGSLGALGAFLLAAFGYRLSRRRRD